MTATNINRIAFIDVNGQLHTVDPDGDGQRQLTTEERVFQFPTWSPDNEAIAVIGGTEHEAGVYLAQEHSTLFAPTLHRIYNSHTQPPIYLSWSPDSNHLTMLALHATYRLALYLLSTEGDETTQKRNPLIGGQPCFWDWHADSQGFLVHVDLGREHARLAHVRWRDDANVTTQTVEVQPGYFQAPAITTDGRYLAYAQRSASGESQLVVASRERKQLLGNHPGIATLSWSPSGRQLAFIHPAEPAQNFYGPLRAWDAGHDRVDILTRQTVLAFFWSPNGQWIAYFTLAAQPASPAASQPARSTNGHAGGGLNGHVKGSWPFLATEERQTLRLGLHVVHVSSGRTHTLTEFEPGVLFVNQFMPFFDQYAKSHCLWSPDSSALVLPMVVNRRNMICTVAIQSGHTQPITEGVMASWSW
jgi:TolB protein